MHRFLRSIAVFALGAALSQLACAQTPAGNSNNNPDNSAIRRANPNSMQGTQPNSPAVRGTFVAPASRPATLENGGIGNRYPRSDSAPPKPTPKTPTTDANGNRTP